MAYLLDVAAEAYFPLAPHHTFGRLAKGVDTHIDKPYVSKLHAAIEWNGAHWCIKHLGLNGTWINGIAMTQGETRKLALNDEITLASQADPGFKVMELRAPGDMLWPLISPHQSHAPIYLSRYHLLPEEDAPELAIYFDEQAQQWYREAIAEENEAQPLNDGDLVQYSAGDWQFVRAQIFGPTEAKSARHLNDFEFVFHLSLDEETTQLELRQQQIVDFGIRTHHYLLLQLARHRADDALRGLDSKSQGWVYAEDLALELGLDSTHMNIQIFRARKQLADNLPDALGQPCLLERRGGRIRFGCEKFKIFKGEQLITASPLKDC
jgi:hypothetical protein